MQMGKKQDSTKRDCTSATDAILLFFLFFYSFFSFVTVVVFSPHLSTGRRQLADVSLSFFYPLPLPCLFSAPIIIVTRPFLWEIFLVGPCTGSRLRHSGGRERPREGRAAETNKKNLPEPPTLFLGIFSTFATTCFPIFFTASARLGRAQEKGSKSTRRYFEQGLFMQTPGMHIRAPAQESGEKV